MEAKREIELAAEHFTQIRASRRHSQGGCAPGHVTAYVRVPLRVVGLVVGPKGATIKRIQQESHTYIVTPSREREPIFEVTGLPQNVDTARREIEQHIYQRTGNMPITDPTASIQSYEMAALNSSNIPRMNAYSAQSQQQPQMRPLGGGYGAGNEYCGVENLYRAGLRSGLKSYSSSGSPPPLLRQWNDGLSWNDWTPTTTDGQQWKHLQPTIMATISTSSSTTPTPKLQQFFPDVQWEQPFQWLLTEPSCKLLWLYCQLPSHKQLINN